MNIKDEIKQIGLRAKEASYKLATLPTDVKDKALKAMSDALKAKEAAIIAGNEKDLKNAKEKGRSSAIIDRLRLTHERILSMAEGIMEIASLKDPVGQVKELVKRPNGLLIGKMSVPMGVIGIIYEARPNVTSDCAALCIKSGNAIILRGGSEAIHSNQAIYDAIREAGVSAGLPENSINFISSTDREAVDALLELTGIVDLVIPRGGESLIAEVVKKARVPVIKHYKGVCHVYVDKNADLDMASDITFNAKVQRPGVCNAIETLLVHKDAAPAFLPGCVERLKKSGVEVRGCEKTRMIVSGINAADESDWYAEYLDLIISVKVVDSIDEAILHIRKYGSMHSDAIVTENYADGMRFINEVDSACVYLNASTRFTDGNQFGKGAEMGISTDKFHARGPMGLEELTSYKYVIFGNGQIRE